MFEKRIEQFVSAPSLALEKSLSIIKMLKKQEIETRTFKQAKNYWNNLGPGLVTGAADDDPSGIATYSQTGAQYGFQLLWLALFTFPLMALVQEMCARIGLVTGRGLAGNIRIHYSPWVLYTCATLLFIANTLNLGADIGAMAKGVQLLFPQWNYVLLTVGFTVAMLLLTIFTSYEDYAKYLKYLALVLLSYVAAALLAHIDPKQLLHHTIIPSLILSRDQIFLVTGILGTTISPYLFFWQTSQEVEEEILKGKTTLILRKEITPKELKKMRIDVWSGMLVSNVVMFFIIAACAATLFTHGITDITSASQAALALKPFAGNYAYVLFALGIIGAGLLAVPILAGSAAYTFAESLQWKSGLYRKLSDARAFYGVFIFSMFIGLAINYIGVDPIKDLIYSAVVNGLVAPIILILIVQMTSKKKIMGNWTNHPAITTLGWVVIIIMIVSGVATVASLFMH